MIGEAKRAMWPLLVAALVVALGAVACGETTTERLAKAATPPTSISAAANTPTPTSGAQPTDTPREGAGATPTETPVGPTSTAEPTNTPEPTSTSTPKPTPTPEPEDVVVVASGFGQDERRVGYGFVVSNPNADMSIESTQFQIAAFDDAGAVVETDSGYIPLLLPSQQLGIGGDLFLDEGVKVAKLEVQLGQSDAEGTGPIPYFGVDQVRYSVGSYSDKVTGLVSSPFQRALTDLRVSAIAYDAEGSIIGGGYTYLGFILANGTTGVEVSMTAAGQVASVELHPALSGLTFLRAEREVPADATEITISKSGFGQGGREVGCGLLVQNANEDYAIERSQYRVTLFDVEGYVLAIPEGYISVLLPGETLGVAETTYVEKGEVVARADFQVLSGEYEASGPLPRFTSENISYQAGTFSSKTTGMIVNPYQKDITNLQVAAIAYDGQGNIVGGGYSYLDFVPGDSRAAVEVATVSSGAPVSVELYATLSGLSEIE